MLLISFNESKMKNELIGHLCRRHCHLASLWDEHEEGAVSQLPVCVRLLHWPGAGHRAGREHGGQPLDPGRGWRTLPLRTSCRHGERHRYRQRVYGWVGRRVRLYILRQPYKHILLISASSSDFYRISGLSLPSLTQKLLCPLNGEVNYLLSCRCSPIYLFLSLSRGFYLKYKRVLHSDTHKYTRCMYNLQTPRVLTRPRQ